MTLFKTPEIDLKSKETGGISSYRLANGTVVKLDGFVRREHWASFDIVRGHVPIMQVDPFSVGRSQCIPGGRRCVTAADASIPRPGSSGLPQDWSALIFDWRAEVVGPDRVAKSGAMASWLHNTAATLTYNSKWVMSSPLWSLVHGSRQMPVPPLPFRLSENLSFGVNVEPQSVLPAMALALTMKHAGTDLTVRIYLSGFWQTAHV